MADNLERILSDARLARALSRHGLRTILERHTCAHRVDELLAICRELALDVDAEPAAGAAEERA
jgi:spore maturation protein CgeB